MTKLCAREQVPFYNIASPLSTILGTIFIALVQCHLTNVFYNAFTAEHGQTSLTTTVLAAALKKTKTYLS